MPGVFNLSVDEAVREAAAAKGDGIRSGAAVRTARAQGRHRLERLRSGGARAVGRARAEERSCPDMLVDHRRVLLRVHRSRPLRHRHRRRDCERSDGGATGADGRLARRRWRRHRRALGHDGRARWAPSARRSTSAAFENVAHHVLRRQVLLGVLRPVPRGRRVGAEVRRSPVAPDGSGERRSRRCARWNRTSKRAPTS